MFTVFKLIKKLLHYLNANEKIENITLSISFSIFYSLIPFNPLFHPILFFLVIILNGNILFFLFLTPIFLKITILMYPLLHVLGNSILQLTYLDGVFQFLYNTPFFNYLNWNNTVSLGGYVVIIICSLPIYKAIYRLIKVYRESFLPEFKKSKISKLFKLPTWLGGQ